MMHYKFHGGMKSHKLTSAERKELPAKVFCGPDRSFPVTDLKHAAVAKAYLNRSHYSDRVKKDILACINRKQQMLQKGVK